MKERIYTGLKESDYIVSVNNKAMCQFFKDVFLFNKNFEIADEIEFVYDNMKNLYHSTHEYKDDIQDTIKKMDYKDFLQTAFWKIISTYVKEMLSGVCALCDSDKMLEIHHSTYKYHGNAGKKMYNLAKLTTLCHKCHSQYHKGKKK